MFQSRERDVDFITKDESCLKLASGLVSVSSSRFTSTRLLGSIFIVSFAEMLDLRDNSGAKM